VGETEGDVSRACSFGWCPGGCGPRRKNKNDERDRKEEECRRNTERRPMRVDNGKENKKQETRKKKQQLRRKTNEETG
jgi:hypothetical protein